MRTTPFYRTVPALLLGAILFISTRPAQARSINDALGKTSFTWLKSTPDAGITAAGECFAARDGMHGLLVHPAAVAGVEEKTLKLSYVSHYVDTQYGSIGYAGKIGERYVGFRVSYVNYGEFIRTNKIGEREGTFTAGDMAFTVNIGRKLRDDLKVGASVSYLTSKIEEFTAQAVSLDLGCIYYPPFDGLTVGAALMNLGTVTKAYSSGYNDVLPVTLVIGARKKLRYSPFTLMADVQFPNDHDIVYAFGLEASVMDTFFLFAGTKSRDKIDVEAMKSNTDYAGVATFGVGLIIDRYRFNYAFCPDNELENIHKVTLGLTIP
ncbi:MAG: PorV/PorQ family protein [Candidatus Latescibacteria bacterium]|nr:PorV/PorQ family protein [Candidatus Latescibacterota bacterium]